jgi:ankyrin repeat protein
MSLPERPNLEYLKKLAKDRLPALRRVNSMARLADAQLVVAREHGFPSWRALRARLQTLEATPEPEPSWPAETIQTFFDAIQRGDEAAVRAKLASDPRLAQAADADGSTALLQAAEWNQPAMVALFLARGADPQRPYAHSAHTPLSWALTVGALDAARALVRGGVEPDLFCAAGLGDVTRVRAFFDAEGRLRPGASRTGSSRYAADGSRLPCPPGTDREVISDAVYIASRNGQDEVVAHLLTRSPELGFRAFLGGTALHWAYWGGSRLTVDLLLRAGADPTARDGFLRCTPRAFGICLPANWGWTAKVRQRLAEDRALAGILDGRGAPLHEAAREGHAEIVDLLLEAGADPRRPDADGKTPWDLALERPDRPGCVEAARRLERAMG